MARSDGRSGLVGRSAGSGATAVTAAAAVGAAAMLLLASGNGGGLAGTAGAAGKPAPQPAEKTPEKPAAKAKSPKGKSDPRNPPAADPTRPEPPATSPDSIRVAKGFRVELLYSVPKEVEGSWVSMAADPKGRLYVCDQHGGLFRVTPPALGTSTGTKVEKVPVDFGHAQGLLWAFDSLYGVVNSGRVPSGLYRMRDTDGDDRLDQVVHLKKMKGGGGEHGPHAVLLTPDGKGLVVVCGNQEPILKFDTTRVPPIWGEDHLLPQMPDGRGFMAGVLGPGGAMYRTDAEGKAWELLTVGYRNQYDAAFHRDGDLFTYDADMEWDFNTPWYRPTRVCLSASGGEFGWRNGAGKWPAHYVDSLPAVVDIGPGSPTGVTFGYGARFPAKYHDALFIADWSYGKVHAVHLAPEGSAYRGTTEEFLSGTPLQVTDMVVSPTDGALYFAIGGRRVKSGLYRVTYAGTDPIGPAKDAPAEDPRTVALRAARRSLEALHGKADPASLDLIWKHLGHEDRYIRFAARAALEFQDPAAWRDRALAETDPAAAIQALLALARVTAPCPMHKKNAPAVDDGLRGRFFDAVDRLGWAKLDDARRLELLRVLMVGLHRLGDPDEARRKRLLAALDPHFPAADKLINGDLCQVLVHLGAADITGRALKQMAKAPTQEEQIEYARTLRMLKTGWTLDQRREYFTWMVRAEALKGGNSFGGFLARIKSDAVATLTAEEKAALKTLLEAKPASLPPIPPRPFVKKWTMDDLVPGAKEAVAAGRNFERGRAMFGAGQCFNCHRFKDEGGAMAPDLTGASGRFSPADLLESIILPSKTISDQYGAVMIRTHDEKIIVGRIMNANGDGLRIMPNMLDPNDTVVVNRRDIDEMKAAPKSMMPDGLLDTLNKDEVYDLLAYLLSRGDPKHPAFAPAK